jgi:chromate reductase
MLTILSGSNRPGSNTLKVARQYALRLEALGVSAHVLDLAALPPDAFAPCAAGERHPAITEWQERHIRPAQRLLIVSPEYNGSIPGVLKAFIDYTDVKAWPGKLALLAGVATGRAGNLRGMDHLTNILLHIGVTVHPSKLPISRVGQLLDGEALDPDTLRVVDAQLRAFLQAPVPAP